MIYNKKDIYKLLILGIKRLDFFSYRFIAKYTFYI